VVLISFCAEVLCFLTGQREKCKNCGKNIAARKLGDEAFRLHAATRQADLFFDLVALPIGSSGSPSRRRGCHPKEVFSTVNLTTAKPSGNLYR
jgi:hypothetical protein